MGQPDSGRDDSADEEDQPCSIRQMRKQPVQTMAWNRRLFARAGTHLGHHDPALATLAPTALLVFVVTVAASTTAHFLRVIIRVTSVLHSIIILLPHRKSERISIRSLSLVITLIRGGNEESSAGGVPGDNEGIILQLYHEYSHDTCDGMHLKSRDFMMKLAYMTRGTAATKSAKCM